MKLDFLPRLERTWAALAVGVGTAAYGAISGGIQKHKAKEEAAKLQASRPKEKESPYAKDALSLAESELSVGISGKLEQAIQEGEDKDFSGSLQALLKGGGDVNNISKLFSNKQFGRQRLALMQEQIHQNQLTNLQRAQQINEEDAKQMFEFNDWMPWADTAQGTAIARQQAQDKINKSVESGIASAGSAASSYLGNQQLDNYFKTPKGPLNEPYSSPDTSLAQTVGAAPNPSANAPNLQPMKLDWNTFDTSIAQSD